MGNKESNLSKPKYDEFEMDSKSKTICSKGGFFILNELLKKRENLFSYPEIFKNLLENKKNLLINNSQFEYYYSSTKEKLEHEVIKLLNKYNANDIYVFKRRDVDKFCITISIINNTLYVLLINDDINYNMSECLLINSYLSYDKTIFKTTQRDQKYDNMLKDKIIIDYFKEFKKKEEYNEELLFINYLIFVCEKKSYVNNYFNNQKIYFEGKIYYNNSYTICGINKKQEIIYITSFESYNNDLIVIYNYENKKIFCYEKNDKLYFSV